MCKSTVRIWENYQKCIFYWAIRDYGHECGGAFSVQIGDHNPFGRTPFDQATEETCSEQDTQTAGGTSGFSHKPGAVSNYNLTAEYCSTFLEKMRAMIELLSFCQQ